MSFLITHLLSIIIIAVIVAVLGAIWAFMASHNAKNRDPDMQVRQDKACENCSLASMCSRIGHEDQRCDEFSSKQAEKTE